MASNFFIMTWSFVTRFPTTMLPEMLKSVRNELKKSIKETKRTFLKKLLSNKNCAETWKVINKILHPNPATVKVNPDEVNIYFNQTATRTTGKAAGSITDEFFRTLPKQQRSFDLREVTYDDVIKAIKSLRSDCSTGYDNIPAKFIKPVAEYLVSPMTNIINTASQHQQYHQNGRPVASVPYQKSKTHKPSPSTDQSAPFQYSPKSSNVSYFNN